jgi:hypothetical protein
MLGLDAAGKTSELTLLLVCRVEHLSQLFFTNSN